MRGAQRGAKKSVPRLRWFPLRANPAAPSKEAVKSGRIRNEEGGASQNPPLRLKLLQQQGKTK